MSIDRRLSVLADDQPVAQDREGHMRLTGHHTQTLYPDLFLLYCWNLQDKDYWRLKNSKFLKVSHGETLLACGEIVNLTRETVEEGSLVTVSFALGFSFWNRFVSLEVPAGTSACDTVEQLLEAAGSEFQLLVWPENNVIFTRPQAFHGKVHEAVSDVLSACGVCPYLIPAGIALHEKKDAPIDTFIDMDSVSGPWINVVTVE